MIWVRLPVPHIACGVTENCSLRERVTKPPEFDANSLGVTVTFYRKKEIVAMWNGNNGDPTVAEKVTKKVTENQQFIINKSSENPEITVAELSELLGISLRKTKENMRKLREAGLIRRIGPDKGGHWEVVEE